MFIIIPSAPTMGTGQSHWTGERHVHPWDKLISHLFGDETTSTESIFGFHTRVSGLSTGGQPGGK